MLTFRGEGNVAAVRDRISPVPMKRLAGTSDAGVELEVPAPNSGGRCVQTGSIGTSGSYERSKNRGNSSELHDDENLASRQRSGKKAMSMRSQWGLSWIA
jgi:hypothetical protein